MDMSIYGMVLIKKDCVNFIVIIQESHLYVLVMMVSQMLILNLYFRFIVTLFSLLENYNINYVVG